MPRPAWRQHALLTRSVPTPARAVLEFAALAGLVATLLAMTSPASATPEHAHRPAKAAHRTHRQHATHLTALRVRAARKVKPTPGPSPSPSPTSTAPTTTAPTTTAPTTTTPAPGPSGVNLAATTGPLRDRMLFGASIGDLPTEATQLAGLEQQLGANVDIASSYVDWTHVLGGPDEQAITAGGRRIPLLSWEPFGVRFTDVTSGKEDGYLSQVATSMAAYPYTLYVRPWPEMNAHWSTWQPTAAGDKTNGGTQAQFVAAWRYLVDFFRSRGIDNLKFVFSVDASDWSSNTRVADIWPGTSYVDVTAIDGYNWGNSALTPVDTGDRWRSFDTIFTPMYGQLTALAPSLPVWITETGCKNSSIEDDSNYPDESSPADPTNSTADWWRSVFSDTGFPQLKAVVVFDKRKERDWTVTGSATTLDAVRQQLAMR